MHTQASRKVCMHTVTLINVHDSLHTCRPTGPTWTGLPSYTRNQANKCTRAHTRTLARTLTTLLFCRAYWGLGGLFWSHAQRRTHTDTHTLQTSICPLTLKTLPVPVNHSALPLLSRGSCVAVMGSFWGAEGSIVLWQRFLCILSRPTAPSVYLPLQSFFLYMSLDLHLKWLTLI